MSDKLAVLMYHAVVDDGMHYINADPHYSVSGRQFSRHLDLLERSGLRACSVAALRRGESAVNAVAMTFDDGHVSNGAAAEELAARGFSADFFVNPSTVGTPGYLSWEELKAMAAVGMSIQSHGWFHRYLDELAPDQVVSELVNSKREIEDRIGQVVTVFAPPGGRIAAGTTDAVSRAGYRALCTSRVGIWDLAGSSLQIPRLAVLQSTTEAQFSRWIEKKWQELAAQRARYLVLSSAKRLLGNQSYERLRLGLLRSGRP